MQQYFSFFPWPLWSDALLTNRLFVKTNFKSGLKQTVSHPKAMLSLRIHMHVLVCLGGEKLWGLMEYFVCFTAEFTVTNSIKVGFCFFVSLRQQLLISFKGRFSFFCVITVDRLCEKWPKLIVKLWQIFNLNLFKVKMKRNSCFVKRTHWSHPLKEICVTISLKLFATFCDTTAGSSLPYWEH